MRDTLFARGGPDEAGFIRFAYRPFDNRWLYWEAETKLLDEKRADYMPHVFTGNLWLVTQQKPRREWSPPQVIASMGCLDLMDRGATCIPVRLHDDGIGNDGAAARRANLSGPAQRYLDRLGLGVGDLFHHVLAALHDPAYREANAGALKMEWPRIPLPGWPDGEAEDAAQTLAASAARGRELAALLDPDTPVPGVTQGALHPEITAVAVPATADGRNMMGEDFALTAGWGHYGQGGAVMPGQGRVVERAYTPDERAVLGEALPTLGETTFDIYLNGNAYWRNVPPPFGVTNSAATKSSRNGSPTASATSSTARSSPRKSNTLPTLPGGSGPCCRLPLRDRLFREADKMNPPISMETSVISRLTARPCG